MNRHERLESYSKGYYKLLEILKEFPEEMRNYKPAHDKWSVNEIIIHIADSESNGYCRARKLIAEPGSTVMLFDQDSWANKLDYSKQSVDYAFELFKILRRNTYNIIKDLPDETWNNYIFHPEKGKMTLSDWLVIYDDHIKIHINQMKRNLDAWLKSKQ